MLEHYFNHNMEHTKSPQEAFRRGRVGIGISVALNNGQALRLEQAFPLIFCSTIDVTTATVDHGVSPRSLFQVLFGVSFSSAC